MLNNDLYFDSTFQFNRFLDKCVEIGFGSEATIYAIDHKTAFKYYDCMPQIIIDEGITKFNDIQNDTYVFAKNIVFVEGNPVGTLMPQIHAKDLTHADYATATFDNIIKANQKFRADTISLTDQGIKINDMYLTNILFKTDKYKVIDTDNYEKPADMNYDEILRRNYLFLTYALEDAYIKQYFEVILKKSKKLKKYYLECYQKNDLIPFIEVMFEFINQKVSQDINCAQDLKQLKKTKKSK